MSEREKKRVETMKAKYGNDVFMRWGRKSTGAGFKKLKEENPEKFWDIIQKRENKRKRKI